MKPSSGQQLTVSECGLGGEGDEQALQYQSDVGNEGKGDGNGNRNGKRKDVGRLRKNQVSVIHCRLISGAKIIHLMSDLTPQLVAIAEEDDDVEFVPPIAQRTTRETSRKEIGRAHV